MRKYNIEKDMHFLQLLSNSFPTIADASTEIINLQAILNLPKGTEHFLADIHGEYEAPTCFEKRIREYQTKGERAFRQYAS